MADAQKPETASKKDTPERKPAKDAPDQKGTRVAERQPAADSKGIEIPESVSAAAAELPDVEELTGRRALGQILKEMRLVTESQIQEAIAIQRQRGGALGSTLVSLNYVTEEEVLTALGVQSGMEVVDLDSVDIPRGPDRPRHPVDRDGLSRHPDQVRERYPHRCHGRPPERQDARRHAFPSRL